MLSIASKCSQFFSRLSPNAAQEHRQHGGSQFISIHSPTHVPSRVCARPSRNSKPSQLPKPLKSSIASKGEATSAWLAMSGRAIASFSAELTKSLSPLRRSLAFEKPIGHALIHGIV